MIYMICKFCSLSMSHVMYNFSGYLIRNIATIYIYSEYTFHSITNTNHHILEESYIDYSLFLSRLL